MSATEGNAVSHPGELNPRPTDYESVALPTELGWHIGVRAGDCDQGHSIPTFGREV